MCHRITCKQCNKPGWRGCGAHVEQILGDVPRAGRCQCPKPSLMSAISGLFGGGKKNR